MRVGRAIRLSESKQEVRLGDRIKRKAVPLASSTWMREVERPGAGRGSVEEGAGAADDMMVL